MNQRALSYHGKRLALSSSVRWSKGLAAAGKKSAIRVVAATFSSGVLLGALLGSRGGAAITTVAPADGPAHVMLPAMVEEDVLQPSLPTVGRRRRRRRRWRAR